MANEDENVVLLLLYKQKSQVQYFYNQNFQFFNDHLNLIWLMRKQNQEEYGSFAEDGPADPWRKSARIQCPDSVHQEPCILQLSTSWLHPPDSRCLSSPTLLIRFPSSSTKLCVLFLQCIKDRLALRTSNIQAFFLNYVYFHFSKIFFEDLLYAVRI